MAAAAPARPDGPLTHRQIVTILIGLMMGMFLAALDQTIVATAIRTIADDLKGLDEQAWATTAYLITSTIVTPLYGKLSDIYGRKKFFSPRSRSSSSARCCAPSPSRCSSWRSTAPSRASAPAACSRWRWPSSATSCRRGSAPSTRATSWPCSAPRACSARSSAGSSPARTPSSASTAGAGSSSSTCRSASPPCSWSPAPCTCTTPASTTASTGGARRPLGLGLVPLLLVAEQGRDWGWGSAARSPATSSARSASSRSCSSSAP